MIYQIKSGDTLSALAAANKTDIATIQKLNPTITDPNKIYAGANLNLPDAPAATPPSGTKAPAGQEYGPTGSLQAVSSSDEIRVADAAKVAAQTESDQKAQADLERARIYKEMADIKASVVPPGGAPTKPDLKGEYTGLLGEKDAGGNSLQDYQTKLTENRAQRDAISAEVSTFKRNGSAGQPEGSFLNQLSEKERNAQDKLDSLDREANVINQQITNRTDVINTLMGLKKDDYANSTAEYDKQFTRNLQIQNLLQGAQAKALNATERAQSNAQANLKTLTDSLKGTPYSSLDATTKALIDGLETQSGYQRGFTESVINAGAVAGLDYQFSKSNSDGTVTVFYKTPQGKIVQGETMGNAKNNPTTLTPEEKKQEAYKQANQFLKDNPDASYTELRGALLEKTVLGLGEIDALLESSGKGKDSMVPPPPDYVKTATDYQTAGWTREQLEKQYSDAGKTIPPDFKAALDKVFGKPGAVWWNPSTWF